MLKERKSVLMATVFFLSGLIFALQGPALAGPVIEVDLLDALPWAGESQGTDGIWLQAYNGAGTYTDLPWVDTTNGWALNGTVYRPQVLKETNHIRMQPKKADDLWVVYSWMAPEANTYDFDLTFTSLVQSDGRTNDVYVYVGDDYTNYEWTGTIDHWTQNLLTPELSLALLQDQTVRIAVDAESARPVGLEGTISYTSNVPIPATAWLLGFGLVGLVGFRRRAKEV